MLSSDAVTDFIESGAERHPGLYKALRQLNDSGQKALADFLARFDRSQSGHLEGEEADLARSVLLLLHRASAKGLALLARVLQYFDCNANTVLDHRELTLAVEVLQLFCKADSDNETLSNKELEVLCAVLETLDTNGNGVLDRNERTQLRDELWDAPGFLAKLRADNPKVRALLE